MKFYLHYELSEPEFTLPFTVDPHSDTRSVSDVLSEFVDAYNARFADNKLDVEILSLCVTKLKSLPGHDPIVSHVKSNTDVFLSLRKGPHGNTQSKASEQNKGPPEHPHTTIRASAEVAKNHPNPSVTPASKQTPSVATVAPKSSTTGNLASQSLKAKWTRPQIAKLESHPPQVQKVS